MDWSFLKVNTDVLLLLKKISMAILLQIMEQLMEPIFTCPCSGGRIHFVCLYFIIPAFALVTLTFALQQRSIFAKSKLACVRCNAQAMASEEQSQGSDDYSCDGADGGGGDGVFLKLKRKDSYTNLRTSTKGRHRKCSRHFFLNKCAMPAYLAACWIVILLIDGKYWACAQFTRCGNATGVADMKDPEMVENMVKSKCIGLYVVFGMMLVYIGNLVLEIYRSPKDRYEEMYERLLKDDREEYIRAYAKTRSQIRATRCKETLENLLQQKQPANTNPAQPGSAATVQPADTDLDAATIVEEIEKCFH
ncbi:hypothetical protein MATL_G00228660 [Megalops atlanticus]|uniref:Uncharacterized protein n=1 Tax=Megalops atlanticus TaxID=7932 RepID=A0A9D3T1T9_MEGAT|nr:hypothetical protein MATL_G00228660 [Megalops atlanticus]